MSLVSGEYSGERDLAIPGEGRHPAEHEIMMVAAEASLSPADAKTVVDEVREAIGQRPSFAEGAGLSRRRAAEIGDIINPESPRTHLTV